MRLLSRLVLASLLVVGGASLRAAFANADAMTAYNASSLVPSEQPGLLGPINEEGRTGWKCLPERAAAATSARAAELPIVDSR